MALAQVIISFIITAHRIIDSAGAYYTYTNMSIKGYSNGRTLKGEKPSNSIFKTKQHDREKNKERIISTRIDPTTAYALKLMKDFRPFFAEFNIAQKCTVIKETNVHNTAYAALDCVLPRSWNHALHDCQKTFPGGTLALITDALKQRTVFKMFDEVRLKPEIKQCKWCGLWIGLANITKREKYEYNYWIDGTPVTYTNWIPGQPSYTWGEEKHVSMVFSRKGQWNDKKSYDLNMKYFACQQQRDRKLSCTEHDAWKHKSSLYQIVDCKVEISWRDAERDCVQKGGHLVSIADEDEQNTVLAYVQRQYNKCPSHKCNNEECVCRFWIGLIQKSLTVDYRFWSDNSEVTYTNFYLHPLHGKAYTVGVVIDSNNGVWEEQLDDSIRKQYICEVPYTIEDEQHRGYFLEEFELRIGDCPGNDLLEHPIVYSLEQCAAFCHRSFHCDGFVYKSVGQGRGECSPKVPIMKRYCENPVQVVGKIVLCYYLKSDKVYNIHSYYSARPGACSNHDIKYKNFTRNMTLEECETLCWLDKRCFGFTFNFNNCSYDKWCGCYIKYLPINEICPQLEPKLVLFTYTVKVIQYPTFYHDFKRHAGMCEETDQLRYTSKQHWPVKICGETCRASKSCYGFAVNYLIKRSGFPKCYIYSYRQLNCKLVTARENGTFSWFKTCCNGLEPGKHHCPICDTCEKAALDDVAAVCASNKQIYQNHCFLMCDICRTGHPMTVITDMAYCTGNLAKNQRIVNRMRKTLYISEIKTCDEACTYCYRVHRTDFAKWHDKDYILNFQSCLDKCVHSGVAPRDSLECEMTKKEYASIYYVNTTQVKTVDVMTGLTLG